MKTYWIYILECADRSYYTGISNDAEKRLMEHQAGVDPACYTFKRRPVKLVYYEEYNDVMEAINREKQIKGWSRAKKLALIKGNIDVLLKLSNSKKHPSTSSG